LGVFDLSPALSDLTCPSDILSKRKEEKVKSIFEREQW